MFNYFYNVKILYYFNFLLYTVLHIQVLIRIESCSTLSYRALNTGHKMNNRYFKMYS